MVKIIWRTYKCVSSFQQWKRFVFHLWGVGGDGVEDVDEDEEEGDEEGHPAWNDVHRDEEGDPGNNHEQACALILNANAMVA